MAGKKQVAVADAVASVPAKAAGSIASITIQSTGREELDGLVVNRVTYQGRVKPVYSAALGEAIALLVAAGFTFAEIRKLNDALPTPSMVTGWRVKHPEFRLLLESARPALAENLLHELIDISRDTRKENAVANKVKSDNIKWIMSKMNSKVFGDKLEMDVKVKGDMAGKLEAARRRAGERRREEARVLTSVGLPVDSEGYTAVD